MKAASVDTQTSLNRPARSRALSRLGTGDFHGMLDAATAKVLSDAQQGDQANSSASAAGPHVAAPLLPLTNELSRPPLRPMTEWDHVMGIKGAPQPLKPLDAERHPKPDLRPLDAADSIPGVKRAANSQEDEVQATARKWVAQTFYGTLFKQMRNSPFKSKLFDGGRGGEAFSPMLDQHLIDRMSKGSAKKLTNAIAKRMMGKRGGKSQSITPTKGPTTGTAPPASAPVAPAESPDPTSGSPSGFEGIRIHVPPGLRA